MMRKRIIVIDGVRGVGKTTLIKELSNRLPARNIKKFPWEYKGCQFIYPRRLRLFADALCNLYTIYRNDKNKYYYKKEIIKLLDAAFILYQFELENFLRKKIIKHTSHEYFLLETNHVAVLAYAYAYSKAFKTDTFDDAISLYQNLHGWIIPDLYIVLRCDIPSIFRRLLYRKKAISNEWLLPEFICYYYEFIKDFINKYEPEANVYWINTDQQLQKTLEEAIHLIYSSFKK